MTSSSPKAENRTRQLAAIMFVDMVGYTALMQEDEELARSQRDRHREVLSTLVPQHEGEILQYYGDGTLSVFASAVMAVACAVEIQTQLQQEPVVAVRIGVHTGDIVQDQDGVYGDGVNVASRIEGLAPPGGVLVSGKVHDEIKNHPSIVSLPLGSFSLKNVKTPVEVFGISNEGLVVPTEAEVRAKARWEGTGAAGGAGVGDYSGSDVPVGPGEKFMEAVKERAILQWAITYLAGAWVVLEVLGFVSEHYGWHPLAYKGFGLLAFVGFFIALVVTWFHGARGRQRVTGREVLLIAGLLGVAGVALSTLRPEEAARPGSGGPVGVDRVDSRPSIAVLPFDNFSPNPDDDYFANGVQEDITSALSRIRGLRVPGRSSVEQYRENKPSAREIAAALGVDYLLEGSARVVSGTVRVTVQLIHGEDDEHLWARDFDREFSVEEVIWIQSEVAQEVALLLRAIITPAEVALIEAVPTLSPEAYELYHRAKYRWNTRTEADVLEAISLYQGAIALDPDFAEAHAGLADAYLVLANWGWISHGEAHPAAISAAERALALDSLIANAFASLGGLHLWLSRDWRASEEAFLRAIELDPEYGYAHYWYSALLSALGRHDEAISEAETAAALDPLAPPIAYGLSRSFFIARDYSSSIQEARRALELHPDYGNLHSLLCSALIASGEYGQAEVACRRNQEVLGAAHSLNMGILRAYQGDREAALVEVETVSAGLGESRGQPVIAAMVYAGLGDADQAMDLLESALEAEAPHLEYLQTHPFFDPLRDDPRFQELLVLVGF